MDLSKDDEDMPGERVWVNVYDLNDRISKVNAVSLRMGLGGALHVGVEVFGREWSFCMSGISCSQPKAHPNFIFRETVKMTKTPLTRKEVKDLIRRKQLDWKGEGYDLLLRNCGTFCAELCIDLKVGKLPSWITRLAETSGKMPTARRLLGICTANDRRRQTLQMQAMRARASGETDGSVTESEPGTGYVRSSSCESSARGRVVDSSSYAGKGPRPTEAQRIASSELTLAAPRAVDAKKLDGIRADRAQSARTHGGDQADGGFHAVPAAELAAQKSSTRQRLSTVQSTDLCK